MKGRARACPSHPPPPSTMAGGGRRLRSAAGVRTHALSRRVKPPEEDGPARAGSSASGATSTAPDERGAAIPPLLPPQQPAADEWLPPLAFLPPGTLQPVPAGWEPWAPSLGTPQRPRSSVFAASAGTIPAPWGPQQTLDAWTAAQAAARVYDSVVDLAAAWHARLATLTDLPEFRTWLRNNPEFKPRLSGFLATARGPRQITALNAPHRDRRHTLLHLSEPGRKAPAQPLWPARPDVGREGKQGGGTRPCSTRASANLPRPR